jgi:hypothetical protein
VSLSQSLSISGLNITAQLITGPARHPRATSSMPTVNIYIIRASFKNIIKLRSLNCKPNSNYTSTKASKKKKIKKTTQKI